MNNRAKGTRSGDRRLLTILAMGLLPLLTAGAGSAQTDNPTHIPGQGPSRHAPSGWEVQLGDGQTILTHGPDASPSCLGALCTSLTGTKESVSCVGDGQDRFELIYAHATDDLDRSTIMLPLVRQAFYDASAFMDAEAKAASAGARARLKARCDSSLEATVSVVTLPTSRKAETFSTIVSDLKALGFESQSTKYMIFYDDCTDPCYGGQANIRSDDRASRLNANNYGPSYAIDYDYLDAGPDWSTFLHEVSHTMGAVQLSAPHASGSGGWHCNDGRDIMCYADKGSSSNYSSAVCVSVKFDCNLDDYFNPSPAAGTYLADHWNLAGSYNSFIDHD